MRVDDLLCSPNAHTRIGRISLVSPCARGRRHTRRGHRKWMAPFLLQHWINRTALSLLGSANLVRPRLRPDGPSNIASRHRLGDYNDRTMHPPQVAGTSSSTFLEGKTRRPISPAPEGERASLEGLLNGPSDMASRHRPGKRARLGAPRVGRVRMSTTTTGPCIHRKSRKRRHPLP